MSAATSTEHHTLQAIAKPKQGKGSAREMRRQGYIPAIIYGGQKTEPTPLAISAKDLTRALNMGHFFSHMQELKLDGKSVKVLAREIQRHPVTDQPLHIDFMAYNASQEVSVNVMVHVVDEEECPGLKQGGVVQLVEAQIGVVCRADSIPEEITVSVAGLEIGDVVHLSDIQLPEGATPAVTDRDLTILSIINTRTAALEALEAEDAASAEEASAEGEEAAAEGDAKKEEGGDEGKKEE